MADPDYLEFLAMLEQGPEALPSASAQLEAQERAAAGASAASGGVSASSVVVTPLMEYIQQKYASGSIKLGGARGKKKKEEITVTSIKVGNWRSSVPRESHVLTDYQTRFCLIAVVLISDPAKPQGQGR